MLKNYFYIIIFCLAFINDTMHAQNNFMENYSLGMKYMLDGNYYQAFKTFKNAYENGDHDLCAFQLAECYFDGIGCVQDKYEAFKLHKISASNNNPYAAHALAMDYYNGYGCSKNLQEAFNWYKVAANCGFIPQAMNNYASMLANGEGCVKDINEAFKWFLRAADCGDPYALYTVGLCYFSGKFGEDPLSIQIDKQKAKEYLIKSAKQGHPRAAIKLDELFNKNVR